MQTRAKSLILAGTLAISSGGAVPVATDTTPHPDFGPLAYAQQAHAGGRQLLAYDDRGDGRIAEVFGDLRTAQHVAVVVPGSGHRLGNFTTSRNGAAPRRNAKALRAELERQAPKEKVAVIAWTGYDTPERVNLDAARSERATPGARDLARLTSALSQLLPENAEVTLVCHSYGSVVCGRAAPDAQADDIVGVGSPGMDAAHVSDLHTKAHIWSARTADDPIRYAPDVRIAGLGHGADPSNWEFGATTFVTGDIRGHDSYYEPGSESLANIARIVLGRDSEVTSS